MQSETAAAVKAVRPVRHRHRRLRLGRALSLLLLSAIAVLILIPIFFTFLYSFFPKGEMEAYLKLRGNVLWDTDAHGAALSGNHGSERDYA